MKKYYILFFFLFIVADFFSQEKILIHNGNYIMYKSAISEIDNISFRSNSSIFNLKNEIISIPVNEIDSITFCNEGLINDNIVYIMFSVDTVTILNPLKEYGVNIITINNHVTILSTTDTENIEYRLSGESNWGSLSISSYKKFNITLNNISLTNTTGSVLNIKDDITATIKINGNNSLSDGINSYQNATILSKGEVVFEGEGNLSLKGLIKHTISSNKSIIQKKGNIIITESETDGLHSESFIMNGGTLKIQAKSDAIDAGSGDITINSGDIEIVSVCDDVKGIKCDGILTINNGNIKISIAGAQSKGLSSKQKIIINGGSINIDTSGSTVLESMGSGYSPSYCSAIKCSGDILINNGTLNIENKYNNIGGKGISADGEITIKSGIITVSTAGNGSTYTNENGITDSYTSCCIKSDTNISLLGGKIICSSSGTGGKGISADGNLIIGNENSDNSLLELQVKTSGERFLVSGSSRGGGGRPPGGGNDADYANPKAIKSLGNLSVNSGTILINCTQKDEGGEGLESKSTLAINGGILEIHANDDCINASTHIEINGGNTYCVSTGNDGIDSNGTFTVTGGFTISCGTRSPEEGFDCDNNKFSITGGIIIGTGGNTSNPTTSACTQRSIKYIGSAGKSVCIKNSANEILLLYLLPAYSSGNGSGLGGGNSSSMVLLISDPNFTTGNYTLQYGGIISGGTTINGYNINGTYSGGSTKNFTISSMLTTVQ